jgi:peptide/nickel transport system permease protein
MLRFIVSRLLTLAPVLIGVSILVFLLMRLIPGDAVELFVGTQIELTPEQRRELERIFGMDIPLYRQYLDWIGGMFRGDLGTSLRTGRPVAVEIAPRLPVSAQLAAIALAMAVAAALPLGILSAVRRGTRVDAAVRLVGLLGLSLPGFWLATMLVLLFSRFLPIGLIDKFVPFLENPAHNLRIMLLPSFALAVAVAAVLMRYVRSSLLEVLGQDYIRTARSKGLWEAVVVGRHALRNALIPVMTVLGMYFGYLLGGTVVVEEIFAIPGMGRLMLHAIYQRDYPIVQTLVLLSAVTFVLINLVVDVLYALVDPRIRYD